MVAVAVDSAAIVPLRWWASGRDTACEKNRRNSGHQRLIQGQKMADSQCVGFNCLFIFPPSYVALCASKARHRFGSEKVSWCLETSLFLRLPSRDGTPSLPLVSFFVFYILSYLLSKTWVAFLGAWCPLPAFKSCFVEFTWRLNILLMNLWGRKCSLRPTPPPSLLLPLNSIFYDYYFNVYLHF